MAEYPLSALNQQPSPSDHQRSYVYSVGKEQNTGGLSFTNLRDAATNRGQPSQDTTENKNSFSSMPAVLALIFGSTYCLVVLCILLVLPIIQIGIGAGYRNQCPINPNIPVYLIVSGACGIATIVLTISIMVNFICLAKQNSSAGAIAIGGVIGFMLLIIFFMSLFLLIWFIVGNVWIFTAYKNVVYDDSTSPNYCHRTLYQFAFAMLILAYISMAISCCSSCIRGCCNAAMGLKK